MKEDEDGGVIMANQTEHQFSATANVEKNSMGIYILGAISMIIVLAGIIIDIIFGSVSGGNLSALPQTAIERFEQFHGNTLLGLYDLDLLNMIIQLIMIPVYFALFAAHRHVNRSYASLALIVFIVGTMLLVMNNTALPMLELSNKYFASTAESQKALYAAAGEAMLARGSHGSPNMFLGFFLPNIGGLLMSLVMLKGKIFSQVNSWLGIAGNALMLAYVILVTFVPGVKNVATVYALPGGLLLLAWMILFTVRLFRLGGVNKFRVESNPASEG